jgi:hypothetical protein
MGNDRFAHATDTVSAEANPQTVSATGDSGTFRPQHLARGSGATVNP